MRRKNETEYIDKICSYCGNVSLFQHTPTKRITMFTKTSSWCFKCKRITTQYILNDFDIAYHNLKNLEVLTENEKEVLNIIEGKKNNIKEKKLILKNEKK